MGNYTQQELDKAIDKAAERAVGFYYEKAKHHIDLVLESLDFMKQQLNNMVTRDEFSKLVTDAQTIRLAVTDTNRELHCFDTPGWFPGKKKR